MATELKSDFYAADKDKIINISDYTPLENGEIEDIFPKEKLARVIAKFLPRPEEVDEDFDDIVVGTINLCVIKLKNLPKSMILLWNRVGRLDLRLL